MKKMKFLRDRKLKGFGMIMLSIIGLILFLTVPVVAGVMTATLAIPAGLDLSDKEKAAMQAVVEAVNKEVDRLSKGYINEDKFSELATQAIKDYLKDNDPSKAKILELEQALKDQGLEIVALKEGKAEGSVKTFAENVFESYKANIETIKALNGKQRKNEMLSFDVKAVGTMQTNTHITGTGLMEYLEPGLTRIARRMPFLRDIMNTANTTSPLIKYVEYVSPQGDAAATAQGAKKSQIDFQVVVRSAEAKKITAFIKVSQEMIEDLDFIQGEINNDLMERLNLKFDVDLMSGSGVDENMKGILEYAPDFAAGTFAGTVERANKFDVLRVAVATIYNNLFIPTYIVLNPLDYASMELVKTADGIYVLPPFRSSNGTEIAGVPIISNTGVTAGTFLVGDFTKSNLRIRKDGSLMVGYENDDFTKNLVTILAELRAVHYVKNNHLNAFVQGDFDTAIAAISAE